MFYTSFLLNNSFCSVEVIKYYGRVLPWDAYTAGLPLCVCVCVCVSLPSTSEWHTTKHDITQLTAESDWRARKHYKHYDKADYFHTSEMTMKLTKHMKNMTNCGKAMVSDSWILQPNWTLGIWNYCACHRQNHFQTISSKETQKVWHKLQSVWLKEIQAYI